MKVSNLCQNESQEDVGVKVVCLGLQLLMHCLVHLNLSDSLQMKHVIPEDYAKSSTQTARGKSVMSCYYVAVFEYKTTVSCSPINLCGDSV